MYVKKSIVLNTLEKSEKKAILTLECDGVDTSGKLRLYNFGQDPLGIMSLGIYHDGRVEKAGLTRVDNMLYSFGCNLKSLPEKFSCAVINFTQGDAKPLLYGNSEGYENVESVLDSVVAAVSQVKTSHQVEQILNDSIDFDEELKEEVEEEIDKCMTCSDCQHCQYREYYFAHMAEDENKKTEENLNEKEEIKEEKNFYYEIKSQIDKLFEENQTEEYLQNLLPNSKWVKVKVDDEGNYYVLGLIYQEEKLKYICYGVPGVYQKIPPRQLSGFPVWFPLEENKNDGFGYWLSYQDADSGESVKAVVV